MTHELSLDVATATNELTHGVVATTNANTKCTTIIIDEQYQHWSEYHQLDSESTITHVSRQESS